MLMPALTLLFLVSFAAAQKSIQDSFEAPHLPDRSVIIQEGQPYYVRWDSTLQTWFSAYSPESTITNVTLWVASLHQPYVHMIQQNIDVTQTFQVIWNASLPPNEVAQDPVWNFRFAPANFTSLTGPDGISSGPNAIANEIPSPQFMFQTTNTSSSLLSTTATSTASTSSTSATSETLSTTGSTPINTTSPSTSESNNNNSRLSGGAIAGIVVGAVAGLVLICALFFLLLRLKKRDAELRYERSQQKSYSDTTSQHIQKPYGETTSQHYFYRSSSLPPAPQELDARQTQELEAKDTQQMAP
ncbi:hypothetical protein K461DRAFT_316541 [Myriangium duriaei CBS 260.36]|uniref:Mid2 domain-containing protein n=1 Tax=Myriangium duriaei CBS 260.36 TaxID=1168546 RepID=A0A9P4ITD1_9PEZI|nr:hypothetical protein K461DRAFT_316541 [Myriangium duriaei CBS 260.36]